MGDTNSSFYADGGVYDTGTVTSNDVPNSATPSAAPSSMYPGGTIYNELLDTDVVAEAMASAAAAAASATSAAGSVTSAAAILAEIAAELATGHFTGDLTVDGHITAGGYISAARTSGFKLGTATVFTDDGTGYTMITDTVGNPRIDMDGATIGWRANYYYADHHEFYDLTGTILSANIDGAGIAIFQGGASTSSTTGALRVTGGVGISGDVHVGSTIIATDARNAGGVLRLAGGDDGTAYTWPTITFGYSDGDHYRHWLHTRHNTSSDSNAFDFYTCDGTEFGTFPTNGKLGLTIENGRIRTPAACVGDYYPTDVYVPGNPTFFTASPYGDFSGSAFYVTSYYDSGQHVMGHISNFNNVGYGEGIYTNYARGTSASPTAVGLFDELGYLGFNGYDGSGWRGAWISGVVDGAVSAGSLPVSINFYTGAATGVRRFQISSAGIVSVLNTDASSSTTTGALTVDGGAGIGGNINAGGYVSASNAVNTDGFHLGGTAVLTWDGGYTQLKSGVSGLRIELGTAGDPGIYYEGQYHVFQDTSGSTFSVLDATSLDLQQTTSSTSTTTGALKVAGGAGIVENLNVGGKVTSGGFSQVTLDGAGSNYQSQNDGLPWALSSIVYGNSANSPGIGFAKTRGANPTTHGAVLNSDPLFNFFAYASDGGNFIPTGAFGFSVEASGAIGGNNVPTQFGVSTGVNNYGIERFTIGSDGLATLKYGALFTHDTIGFGYGVGAGGSVTQATSKSTGVTLNKVSGQIVTAAAALAASASVSFTVLNSTFGADDEIHVWIKAAATSTAYVASPTRCLAGSFNVILRNISAGSLSEAVTIGFSIRKATIS